MGEDLSDWEIYILEHSDLEFVEGYLSPPDKQAIVAMCAIFFDNGN